MVQWISLANHPHVAMQMIKKQASGAQAEGEDFKAVANARKLPSEKQNQGTQLFVNAGDMFDTIAPALERGACGAE
jgi:hypothetical protein